MTAGNKSMIKTRNSYISNDGFSFQDEIKEAPEEDLVRFKKSTVGVRFLQRRELSNMSAASDA